MTLKTSKIILICLLATVLLFLFSTNTKTESRHKCNKQQKKREKKPCCNMKNNTEFNREEKTVTLLYAKNGITEKRIYKRNPKQDELQFEIIEGKYKEFFYTFDNSWGEELADSYLDEFHEEINNGVDLYSNELMKEVMNN